MDYLRKSNRSGSRCSFYTHRHRNYHTLASHGPHNLGVAHHDHESTGPHQHHRNIAYNTHESGVVGKPRWRGMSPLEEEGLEPVQEAALEADQEDSLDPWASEMEE